jgi:AhpD family alkylhydroperoxidase
MSDSELRLPYYQLSPEAMAAFKSVNAALLKSTLGIKLIDLVFMRVSQINGCAYCLYLHSKSLREAGESDKRLDTLAGWRLSPHFTHSEKAALAWAESITLIADTHAPDEVFLPLKQYFTDVQISDLTFAISIMNGFNRLAVSMKQ